MELIAMQDGGGSNPASEKSDGRLVIDEDEDEDTRDVTLVTHTEPEDGALITEDARRIIVEGGEEAAITPRLTTMEPQYWYVYT